jgi:hypothetical protein
MAFMLASQLPEGIEDARTIVRLTMDLVNDFLAQSEPGRPAKPALIVPITRE